MAQKNENLILVPTLLITLTILSVGVWWLWQNVDDNEQYTENTDDSSLRAPNTLGEVSNVPSGSFSYFGNPAWGSIQEGIDPIIREIHPQFQIRYSTFLSQTSEQESEIVEQLKNNQIAFSQVSSPLTNEQGATTIEVDGNSLEQIPIALNVIAIAVNRNLDISGLSLEQLQGIYTGEIRNWEEVGGPNLEIIPYSDPEEEKLTVRFFLEDVLDEENLSPEVETVENPTVALRKVSENEGAIYYGKALQILRNCDIKPLPLENQENELVAPYQGSLVSPEECRETGAAHQINRDAFQNGDYPLTRPWFIVFNKNGRHNERAGRTYAKLLLTQQGQHLLRNQGLISIR
ncbi:phosphate ABC transporter substrate-binding protein [Euhalothece natronophila Z-M001]|uniref:Phosphate ABC transporter substrate-binding protein n=1 Tax=Euhalothece natronophila Z-M001 TaxID=522448 RepID=A0A5B8NS78_9CHRO|nr:substrate-binding domain-containing protein [Euhalothece natronophila]QDZ41105.1 phosphate ABC transporter substrate-binding protein [Euhalothece natronophila Z-M001]